MFVVSWSINIFRLFYFFEINIIAIIFYHLLLSSSSTTTFSPFTFYFLLLLLHLLLSSSRGRLKHLVLTFRTFRCLNTLRTEMTNPHAELLTPASVH